MDVDWGFVALLLAAVVPSIIFHEVSHGVVALWFGDDTAKRAGRLTLNPVAHVDPFGTLILPAILSLSGVGAFGYAKPVPVNVRQLRNPRQHSLYVALVGPLTNLLLAGVALLVFRSVRPDVLVVFEGDLLTFINGVPAEVSLVTQYVYWLGLVNVILAVFNVLPIPPLDGSAIVERFLPHTWWPVWLRFRAWGFGVLLLLVFVVPGALANVFEPAIDLWHQLA